MRNCKQNRHDNSANRRGIERTGSSIKMAIVACAVLWSPAMIAAASGQANTVSRAQAEHRGVVGGTLPIRDIVLYRSGVGYFERVGSVKGGQTVSLRFEAGQINDILKSMTLVELEPGAGGSVAGVTYASKEPLERRLKSFGVDVSDAPGIASLFMRLRGSDVRASTPEGEIIGTILGVESRESPAGDSQQIYKRWFVNLVTPGGVRSVPIDSVLTFRLVNNDLNEELSRALASLEEERTERLKTVDIAYAGPDRDREVLVAYVNEAPVWKTSYRLVLPEDKGGASAGKVTLQGWAIVENTTEEDWESVQLTLASGRPVSFTMDLHSPLYAHRPEIAPPVEAGIAPRVYAGGIAGADTTARDEEFRSRVSGGSEGDLVRDSAPAALSRRAMGRAESGVSASLQKLDVEGRLQFRFLDHSSLQSAAWGGEMGEQFVYAIEAPVTLQRHRSAMLPILSTPITGRRVSIYNANEDRQRARRGVQMTNDSGLHLIPGPITVFDGSTYAGDAQIQHTARNDKRLLAYAADLEIKPDTKTQNPTEVVRLRIADGYVEQTIKQRQVTDYTFQNMDSSRPRTMLIEHALSPGYELVAPVKPTEKTDSHYRFDLAIPAGKSASLQVVLENVTLQRIGVTSYSLPNLIAYASTGKASKAVVDAVKKAADLQSQINAFQSRISEFDREQASIGAEQGRIRENMRTIERTSELYARYMTKLNEQESRLETILETRESLMAQLELARKTLEDYVRNLDVE